MRARKVILIIMDGWGIGKYKNADAIAHARTPFYRSLHGKYPQSQLIACGEDVGLPEGQMGNSEVGHLNIGAGRIVYQELQRVNIAIKDKSIFRNPSFEKMIDYAKKENKPLHLMGLVSDGGVHSHIDHLLGILDFLKDQNIPKVFVHVFTDGRDTDPKSGLGFVKKLQEKCAQTGAKIASVSGRYYAMDRDSRWERIQKAYDVLANGKGPHAPSAEAAVQASYDKGVTDEFILPVNIAGNGETPVAIEDGDVVFCFNFRTDRCREITQALSQRDFPEYGMKKKKLYYATMTAYDKSFENVHVIFLDENLVNTLGEVLEQTGKKQIRIAETEKYPHVTYFFSGGREKNFVDEKRIIIPSPKVATYDMKPEMSAREITDAIIPEIEKESADFICLNFANADMVGHTGVWDAVVKAIETVDACVEKIVNACIAKNYTVFLTSDHGNADHMKNEDGSPNTAHSLNPVPFFIISVEETGPIDNGRLADIAPTALAWMNLPIPKEMTGKILIRQLRPPASA